MESNNNKPKKITEIVRLRQMIKKWKKLAAAPKSNAKCGIRFLKRTLSFSESASGDVAVPKGYLAVCVGEEMQRFVIPTEFLAHRAFAALLKEAEEEFGFGQEGVLRIPCGVEAFRGILEAVERRRSCGAAAAQLRPRPSSVAAPICLPSRCAGDMRRESMQTAGVDDDDALSPHEIPCFDLFVFAAFTLLAMPFALVAEHLYNEA